MQGLDNDNSSSRIQYIDYLKAFAIFLVVLGHCMQSFFPHRINWIVALDYIVVFHMPLFALISGLFFKTKCNNQFILDKFKQLIVPIITWVLVTDFFIRVSSDILIWIQTGERIHFFAIMHNIWYGILFHDFWFLRALFFCFVYAFFCVRIFQKSIIKSLIVSAFLLWVVSFVGLIPNKYQMFQGFIFLYPFFATGIILKKFLLNEHFRFKTLIMASSLIIFSICLFFWSGWEDTFYEMNTSIFEKSGTVIGGAVIKKTLFRFVAGLSGSLFFFILFEKVFLSKNNSNSFVTIISYIGKNTLAIYVLQTLVFMYVPINYVFHSGAVALSSAIFATVVIIMGLLLIIKVVEQVPLLPAVLWGNKRN